MYAYLFIYMISTVTDKADLLPQNQMIGHQQRIELEDRKIEREEEIKRYVEKETMSKNERKYVRKKTRFKINNQNEPVACL